ncbi:hypothetical protein [Silvibacterium sp.]|uniref:hypothetical protein n=1 Tax=Silvibacterium sp. TaxID=1964179 RepID=UPI0039E4220A
MTSPSSIQEDIAEPSQIDPRWALAKRIAESATFARSEQLPKLLLYVCRMAITEPVEAINEQRIGVEVFGRARNYDSAVDGIVRSHATRLRQRLERYFRTEGAEETLRLEIPRGSYIPRFYSVEQPAELPLAVAAGEAATEADSSAAEAELALSSEKHWAWQRWIPGFVAGVVAAILLIAVVLHLRHDAAVANRATAPDGQTAVERRFWESLFPKSGKTLIVTGDSGLVLYETLTQQELTLADYVSGDYRDFTRARGIHSSASGDLTLDLASRRYTSVIDQGISEQLSHLPEWNHDHASTIFARDLRPADAAAANLILIGSREANPWVSLVEPAMNFVLTKRNSKNFFFVNRSPKPGELQAYTPRDDDGNLGAANVYGDIAYLPNPGGQGMVLVLCGLWMSGTQSAGKFVLEDRRFSDWLESIAAPDGSIPPFELLLSTRNLQGNSAYTEIAAKRVRGR